MKITPLTLSGALLIEPVIHRDARGFFVESFHARRYVEAGVTAPLVQDNHSRSIKNVLRGLHAQLSPGQEKLVRVIVGNILDVIVDVRVGSPTFKQWEAVALSGDDARQLWVPAGFLHGFLVLSEGAEVEYKCSTYYEPKNEIGVRWNDPEIGIRWPTASPILSGRDAAHPSLSHWMGRLPSFVPSPLS